MVDQAVHEAEEQHAHPGPRVYVTIAVVLGLITLVEVFIWYLPDMGFEGLRPWLPPAFIALSAVKFSFVVLYFMHLKFDPKVFAGIFVFYLLIAASIAVAFIALFHGFYFF
jgi:cytochrome c oxidase subunit IV